MNTKRKPFKAAVYGKSVDGFNNFVGKMGAQQQNLFSAGTYHFDSLTKNRIELEAMYRTSWIVGAAIDTYAEDMTRQGITINSSINSDREQEMLISLNTMGIWDGLCHAIKWGRLYGGAIAVLDIDGQDPESPLDISRIGQNQFKGLSIYDRWQLQVDTNNLIESGKNAGLPAFYTVVGNAAGKTQLAVTYHHSRCLRFIGIKLPFFQAITDMLWGESIIERVYDRILAYDTVTFATTNLINKAHLQSVGVKNMREVMAAGGIAEENLIKQFKLMRLFQSAEGLTLHDSEDSLQTASYNFGGISDIQWQFGQQIAAALDSTMVRLFGQSPSGFSSGDADLRMYYDKVKAKQESCGLAEAALKILKVLHMSKYGEEAPKDLYFDFTPLWQTSYQDKVNVSSALVSQISMLYDNGLLSQAACLKELKQASNETDIFTNISEKDILEAEILDPDPPDPENGDVRSIPMVRQDV